MSAPRADAFYVPEGEGFVATELTRGPWDPRAQHAGPPAALLGRALERCEPRAQAIFGRVTFDILRPIPIGPLTVAARVVRPGRSVEMLEAELRDEQGADVMRATAWRLRTADLGFDPPDQEDRTEPPPGPDGAVERPFFDTGQDVGYHTAMEYRFALGAFREIGPAQTWMRMRHPLVAGEEPTPLQRVLIVADTGNGVSGALDFRRYVFINVDLTVHMSRMPAGEWVCIDAITRPEPTGVALTDTVLWDEDGRLGRAVQTLLVAERE